MEEEVSELFALFRRVRRGESPAIDLTQMLGGHVSPEAVFNTVAMNLKVESAREAGALELDSLGSRFRASSYTCETPP